MERTVVTPTEAAGRRGKLGGSKGLPQQLDADGYLGRLVKYIPVEVIGVHVALQSAVAQLHGKPYAAKASWALFVVVALGAPFYLKLVVGIGKWQQILICEVAFFAWAASLEGYPFFWDAPFRTISAILATFLLPIVSLERKAVRRDGP